MCTPPPGQQWCLCRDALEWAKWLLGLLPKPGPQDVFYPLGRP